MSDEGSVNAASPRGASASPGPTWSYPAEFDARDVAWFDVGIAKLAVMMTGTLGTYLLYWSYRQWQAVNTIRRKSTWPFARMLLWPVFSYFLFRQIKQRAWYRQVHVSWSAGPLTLVVWAGWIMARRSYADPGIVSTLARGLFCGFVLFVPLALAQSTLNALRAAAGGDCRNRKVTLGNGVVMALLWIVFGFAPGGS